MPQAFSQPQIQWIATAWIYDYNGYTIYCVCLLFVLRAPDCAVCRRLWPWFRKRNAESKCSSFGGIG